MSERQEMIESNWIQLQQIRGAINSAEREQGFRMLSDLVFSMLAEMTLEQRVLVLSFWPATAPIWKTEQARKES